MYKCISFLEKSNDKRSKPIDTQFNEFFSKEPKVKIISTQIVSTSYEKEYRNAFGETVYTSTIYQDIMYVWYKDVDKEEELDSRL